MAWERDIMLATARALCQDHENQEDLVRGTFLLCSQEFLILLVCRL